jgi:endonuclease/exonuclease/phosphatase family metal-dependent hydrolase
MAASLVLSSIGAARAADPGSVTIRVMTQNLSSGTDFSDLIGATSLPGFLAAVTATYNTIQASNPAERAAAVAREIARERPDIVGLQEVTILRTGATRPATTVQSDQLQLLLDALAALGLRYQAVAIVPNLDAEAPGTLGFDVRITTRDVIIVRANLPVARVKPANLQIEQYLARAAFSTPAGAIADPRGWASVDVKLQGQTFRFVTTHLDRNPAIALGQAAELVQSAGSTALPVILVCDCNAPPDNSADPSFPAYKVMQDTGFVDAFRQAHPGLPGFTCCQDEDLRNTSSKLSIRIDLIQLRGPFQIQRVQLVGNHPQTDRTPSGLWPSDHAGVVATLRLSAP